jgi:class 3 adenylate cyclase
VELRGASRLRFVTKTFSMDELADETGVSRDRIEWMTDIGILKPDRPGTFRFGDVFRVKLISALLRGGFTSRHVEWALSEGHLNVDRFDEYVSAEPGPRSERTFAKFMSKAGPRASLLPAVYAALSLPAPDPSTQIYADEEERLLRFLDGWRLARSDETLIRAARLIAEGTRMATLGWADLIDEQVAGPAAESVYRGEIERFPDEVREAFVTLRTLQPRMMEWLIERYLEERIVAGIVEGLEQLFASRGIGPPRPTAPRAVTFVDLSGYTRLTEERGDEVAVGFAATLQRHAEAVAASKGGRLVKLLGDGAMLYLPDAGRGVEAAIDLVRALSVETEISAHAGVHAGPVIERDRDLFGSTVNLASRIADAAGPGDVLASQAIVDAVHDSAVHFEPVDRVQLQGIPGAIRLFRARANAGGDSQLPSSAHAYNKTESQSHPS